MNVEWAHTCEAPSFARKKRSRGTKALGLTYERKLAKALPKGTLHGQWFCYSAGGQVKFCQPDFLLRGRSELAVLEAKLTDVEAAREQLEGLYVPVLARVYALRVLPVIVTRSLSRLDDAVRAEHVCSCLVEAIELARAGALPVLHWIGTGRI